MDFPELMAHWSKFMLPTSGRERVKLLLNKWLGDGEEGRTYNPMWKMPGKQLGVGLGNAVLGLNPLTHLRF